MRKLRSQDSHRQIAKLLLCQRMLTCHPLSHLLPTRILVALCHQKVSESLRRLALRKLFHGADFNIRDGLDDYDGDYTSFVKLGQYRYRRYEAPGLKWS